MVGHQLFLKLGEDAALLLRAGNDQLEGGQKILLGHQLAALPHGPQGRFVHQIGKVRAHAARGRERDLLEIHVLGELDAARVDLQRC